MNQEVDRARAANAELERSAREIEDDLSSGRGAMNAELANLQIEYVVLHTYSITTYVEVPIHRFENVKAKILKYKEELRSAIIAKCTHHYKVIADSGEMLRDLELAADASDARTANPSYTGILASAHVHEAMQE